MIKDKKNQPEKDVPFVEGKFELQYCPNCIKEHGEEYKDQVASYKLPATANKSQYYRNQVAIAKCPICHKDLDIPLWKAPPTQEIPVLDFLRKNQPVDPEILLGKFKRFDPVNAEKEGKIKFVKKHMAWTLPDYPDD